MRELTLQKRLGHASPESTRIYTWVSDPAMIADYNQALGPGAPELPQCPNEQDSPDRSLRSLVCRSIEHSCPPRQC
ncbi:MAG TPA: hypothetical protein VFG35_11690, partial [Actinoplanes sp.]|nr:hypothetical protein [Actinoplanes sp.]